MDLGLKDKRALVTGSSRGLGYATALALAKEGCKVAINGRDEFNLTEAAHKIYKTTNVLAYPVTGDASDPAVPEKIVADAARLLDGLDILITNTGGPLPGSIDVLDEAAWQKGIDLCFMSHVRLIKSALPFLRKSESASILTVTSLTVRQPIPNLLISNSVRNATIGLTKSLALEFGREGIRVNSIIPGWTETERVTELMAARAKTNNSTVEEETKLQAADIAFGRMARPEEFANAAAFLVSPAASYITGVMLSVDGGVIKGTM